MSKVFVVDLAKCTGCYNCQLACKDENCGNDWTPYSKPQPMTGQFWAKVVEETHGTKPKVKIFYTPTFCNHCKNAPCIEAGKDGAVYRREDGLVIIDPEKAAGQKQIAEACPYGMIYWNEALDLPQKCTGCAHLLDNGRTLPRCVEACPVDAIKFGEAEELKDDMLGAEVLKPETGCHPQVFYRNRLGMFVGGLVYDPEEEEVIIGAKCRLTNGGKTWITYTDDFGDFWFKDLAKGIYKLAIEKEGYAVKTFDVIRVEDCVSLGDIPMEKAAD